MGLAITLNNALSGLNVNQQALTVLSQNIANANTPGYSRQNLNLQATYLEGLGSGVTVEDITRKVDSYLQTSVTNQTSITGQTGVINDYSGRIQLLLGTPGSNNDITSYLNNFFNAASSLASAPQDATTQSALVNSATTFTTQLNTLANGLQNLRLQADQDVSTAVSAINIDLKNIHDLNQSIATATSLGQSVAGQEDSRDAAINDLAQYLNIQTTAGDRGTVNVYTSGGTALVDENAHQLNFTPAGSAQTFISNSPLSAITVSSINNAGQTVGAPVTLATGVPSSQVSSTIVTGKLAGLLQMRDQTLPGILDQLDSLAANFRDQVNAINNSGSGYPGVTSLTGTKAVSPTAFSQWSGSVRIAVLDANGQPLASTATGTGITPLTLDLSSMNTGQGKGQPSVQGIIDAINNYYTPKNQVAVGNLSDIQLVSNSATVPGASNQFSFDLNLTNPSSTATNVFVTGVRVSDSLDNTINTASLATSAVSVASYDTEFNNGVVTVNTSGASNGLVEGQQIYLSGPSSSVNGINAGNLTGIFTVSNVTATSFQITATGGAQANTTGNQAATGTPTVSVAQASVAANSTARTGASSGNINVSLAGNLASPYYTISADVITTDAQGNSKTSTVTYRITNNQNNVLNDVYGAQTATGDGVLTKPTSYVPLVTASLVDANGNPLSTTNGVYNATQQGYLKLQTTDGTSTIAIDSMDSQEQGQPNGNPPVAATNQGFSSFFDLNDFFVEPSGSNTVAGSALGLQVQKRIINDPSQISMGKLTQSATNPNLYERDIGDNSVIQKLVALNSTTTKFNSAGGLAQSTVTFSSYAGQIIGAASTNASTAATTDTNAQGLLTSYQQQNSAVSGVNLNTELANTIIYQNAYAASARVISVTSSLFTTLLQTFQ